MTLDSYGLFNNAVSKSKYITYNNLRLMNKELVRDVEGRSHRLIQGIIFTLTQDLGIAQRTKVRWLVTQPCNTIIQVTRVTSKPNFLGPLKRDLSFKHVLMMVLTRLTVPPNYILIEMNMARQI
jgi:hypothetical protein